MTRDGGDGEPTPAPSDLRFFSRAGRLLRALLARRGAILAHPLGPEARGDLDRLRETRKRVPLLIGDAAALQILACVRAARRLNGAMAEAGVLMGGTARLICEAKGDSPLHLFDVFETLQAPGPPATEREAELRAHFRTIHGRGALVERLLRPYSGVYLHPGVFPDSTRDFEETRFSFVHVDLDLEPSTRDALEYFHPRLLEGGIILGDDYQDPGVRAVFAAFFAGRADTLIALPWGQVMVVKPARSL